MATVAMRVNPNTPISKALGFDPHGVLVDNVTAFWLYFPQADQYCPPFTMGWSAPLVLNVAGYGYMEIKTPFGQTTQTNVTANVSQYVSLTWSSELVGSSAGVPSSLGQTIDPSGTTSTVSTVSVFTLQQLVTYTTGFNSVILPAVAAKRYRILTSEVVINPFIGIPPLNYDSPIAYFIQQAIGVGISVILGRVSLENPESIRAFSNGLDFPVNTGVRFQATCDYARNALSIVLTYQLLG